MTLRIALLSHQPLKNKPVGGVPLHIEQLAEAMSKLGVEVEIFAPSYTNLKESGASNSFPGNKVILREIRVNSILGPIRAAEYSYKLCKHVIKNQQYFDAIHGSQSSSLFLALNRRYLKIPLISKFHGSISGMLDSYLRFATKYAYVDMGLFITFPYYYSVEKVVLEKSDAIISVSEHLKREIMQYYGIGSEKITTIYNGVNTELFRPLKRFPRDKVMVTFNLDPKYKCVLYVGRIEPLKGVDILLKALCKIKEKLHLNVILVGSPSIRLTYVRRLWNVAEDGGAIFLGKLGHKQLPIIYNLCDVIILPSLYEPFGNVALEALACGKPVITTNISGVSEIIRHYRTGFIVSIEKLEKQLEDCIVGLLQDEELCRILGKNAREHVVRNFSWEKTAQKTISLIRKIILELNT